MANNNQVPQTRKGSQDGGCLGWLVVFGSFICSMFVFGVYAAIGPLLVAIQKYFGATSVRTSWIISLIVFLQNALGPIANVCVKKIGFRMTVMAGAVLSTTGFFVSAFAVNIEFLYLSLGILVGLGYGLVLTPGIGIVALFIKKHFVAAFSIVTAGGGVGTFIFPPLLQICIDTYGWKGAVIVFSAVNAQMGIAAALFGYALAEEQRNRGLSNEESTEREPAPSDFKQMLLVMCDCTIFTKYPAFIAFCGTLFSGIGVGFFGEPAHLVSRAVDKNIGTSDEIAFMASLFGITSVVGRLTPILFSCCRAREFSCSLWFGLAFLAAGIASLLSPLSNTYASYAVFTSILGFLMGFWFSVLGIVLECIVSAEFFVAGIGISHSFAAIGGLLGPICGGYIYDVTGDYDNSFYFYGTFLVLGGIITLVPELCLAKRRRLSKKAEEGAPAVVYSNNSRENITVEEAGTQTGPSCRATVEKQSNTC